MPRRKIEAMSLRELAMYVVTTCAEATRAATLLAERLDEECSDEELDTKPQKGE